MLKPGGGTELHCCPRASASTADESNVARTCGEEYISSDSVDAGERAPHRAALPFVRKRTNLLEARRTHPGRKAPKKEARTGVRASWIGRVRLNRAPSRLTALLAEGVGKHRGAVERGDDYRCLIHEAILIVLGERRRLIAPFRPKRTRLPDYTNDRFVTLVGKPQNEKARNTCEP